MLAPTPPMGWNSWDCYGTSVTEAEVVSNAEFLAEHLLPLGWDTVVVDICWYDPDARAHGYTDGTSALVDDVGRAVPDPVRFPSAAGGAGFGPLAERVHALGLTFGVHVLRGIPRVAVESDLPVDGTSWTARQIADTTNTCTWNPDCYGLDHTHPGAQAYYDSQLAQFAHWGVDFVKADDMLSPYQSAEISAYATAIGRSGRPIALSLSPGVDLSTAHLEHLRAHAQMWRISADLWDRWDDVARQFARMARWAPLQQPGAWADADMLPLGRIGIRAEVGDERDSLLTLEEQRTLMTLWVMGRSPLMVGGDLPRSDPATIALLRNPGVIAVLREAVSSGELLREPREGGTDAAGEVIAWDARAADGRRWSAVFWTGPQPHDVELALSSLGVPARAGGPAAGLDVWSGEPLTDAELANGGGSTGGVLRLRVPGHGARLVRWEA